MRAEPDNPLSPLLYDVVPTQLNVRDLVAACWRGRRVIAATVVIGAVAGAGAGRLTPPRYEAATTFRVSERAGQVTALRTFQVVIESNSLAQDVIRQHKLDEPPNSLTPISFKRDHLIIEQVNDTNLLRAHVTLPEAKLTADVANSLATRAIELYNSMSARSNLGASEQDLKVRKAELDAAIAARDTAEQRLLSFKSQAQVDVLRRDATDLFDARQRLATLRISLQAERGRVASTESELSKQPKTISLPRQVSASEALLLLTVRQGDATGNASVANNLTQNQVMNPVYGQLEGQAATLRTTVAALEREQQELANQLNGRGSRDERQRLADLHISLQAERGRLASTEAELAKQPRTVSIPRRFGASEAFLLSLAEAETGDTGSEAIAKGLIRTEVINPVYAQLETQASTLRTNVAALDAEQLELANQLKLAESPSQKLTNVYERESQIARLQRELEAADRVVSSLSTRYDQARENANAYVPQPEVIDPASLPDESLSRGMLAMALAGLLVGLLLATLYVLARELMPVIRSRVLELT